MHCCTIKHGISSNFMAFIPWLQILQLSIPHSFDKRHHRGFTFLPRCNPHFCSEFGRNSLIHCICLKMYGVLKSKVQFSAFSRAFPMQEEAAKQEAKDTSTEGTEVWRLKSVLTSLLARMLYTIQNDLSRESNCAGFIKIM